MRINIFLVLLSIVLFSNKAFSGNDSTNIGINIPASIVLGDNPTYNKGGLGTRFILNSNNAFYEYFMPYILLSFDSKKSTYLEISPLTKMGMFDLSFIEKYSHNSWSSEIGLGFSTMILFSWFVLPFTIHDNMINKTLEPFYKYHYDLNTKKGYHEAGLVLSFWKPGFSPTK